MTNSTQAANPNPNSEQQASAPVPEAAPPTQPEQATPPSMASEQLGPEARPQQKPPQPEPEQPQETQQDTEIEDKRHHSFAMLEAALYVAGRPLDVNEICSVLNTRSKKKAQQLGRDLMAQYAAKKSAIEILELKDERFVMQVKSEFTPLVKKLVNRPLLSPGPLKTLSYIAYRQPITSKRVIEVRGQHAYGHIKILREMGLVAPERNGRQIVLKTTDYFADYFGLTMDTTTMKRDLKKIFGDALENFKEEPQP